jgi:hypothetical protein
MFLADLLCMILQYFWTVMLINYLAWRHKFLLNIRNMLLMYNLACLTFIRCLEDVLFGFLGHISESMFHVWPLRGGSYLFWLHPIVPCTQTHVPAAVVSEQPRHNLTDIYCMFKISLRICCPVLHESPNLPAVFKYLLMILQTFSAFCSVWPQPMFESSLTWLESLFPPFSIFSKKCLGCFIHFL